MGQFITLKRKDPELRAHLSGSFSTEHLALPISVFGPPGSESFTFELVPRTPQPFLESFKAILNLIRWPLLTLTILPVLFVAILFRDGADAKPALDHIMIFLSLIFFHASLFAFNDYRDHMRGWDVQHQKSGTRTIQKGIFAAYQVRNFSMATFALAAVLAAPFILQNITLVGFALLALIFFAGLESVRKASLVKVWLTQLTWFLCFGPLLVFGAADFFAASTFRAHQSTLIVVSLLFGICALLYLHARQLQHLIIDHRYKAKTLAVRLGFDGTKKLLMVELLAVGGIGVLFLYLFNFSYLTWMTFLPVLLWIFRLAWLTRNVDSPLSSKLTRLPGYFLATHWLLSLWLLAEAWL